MSTEAEGSNQEIRPSPYMSPMHLYGSSIVLLTNPESEIGRMELTFRNVRVNKDGKIVYVGASLMNDDGIASVIGTIQTIVNQVTILSNLSKTDIPILMDFLGDTLARDLMINRVKYDIKSFAARDKIYFTALTSSYITMKRAFEEGDKRFWKGSVQEIHTKSEVGNQGGGSMLSKLNPWKKK